MRVNPRTSRTAPPPWRVDTTRTVPLGTCREDLLVELACLWTVKRQTEHHEHVCESLNPDTDGAVTHVRLACRLSRVVVLVDDPVQVTRDNLCHFTQLFKVETTESRCSLHKCRETQRRQVTHGRLIWCGNLHDFMHKFDST